LGKETKKEKKKNIYFKSSSLLFRKGCGAEGGVDEEKLDDEEWAEVDVEDGAGFKTEFRLEFEFECGMEEVDCFRCMSSGAGDD